MPSFGGRHAREEEKVSLVNTGLKSSAVLEMDDPHKKKEGMTIILGRVCRVDLFREVRLADIGCRRSCSCAFVGERFVGSNEPTPSFGKGDDLDANVDIRW